MNLKNFMTLFLLILFIGQIRETTSADTLLTTYNGIFPGYLYLGKLNLGDKLVFRLLVPGISYNFPFQKGPYLNADDPTSIYLIVTLHLVIKSELLTSQ